MNTLNATWLNFLLRCRVFWAALRGLLFGKDNITPVGSLFVKVIRTDGRIEDLGLRSTKVVTTAGVEYLVDSLQGSVEPELLRFHGCGTGAAAEAIGNTALGTEVGSRVSGSQTEGSGANVYRTVATINFSGSFAITEHGIFSASSGGTLLDRSVFAAINVANGDSIQFTYDLTLPAGS